jgi:hypothetical protein
MRTRLSGRNSHRGRTVGILVAALAGLFVLARLFIPDIFIASTAPVFAVGDALAARTEALLASFGDARALAAKNKELMEQNAVLAVENQALTEKVKDLSAFFASTTPGALAGEIMAGVLMRPPTAPYDTLVLEGGERAGIAPLMEAYGAGNVPLGIVKSTTAQYARLVLFSSPGVLTDAWIGEGRLPAGLRGMGAGAFTAEVSQASGIAVGDLVYLAAPGAVPVGRVAHISGAASDPVATLAIQPLVNPFTIAWVELRESPESASTTLRATP